MINNKYLLLSFSLLLLLLLLLRLLQVPSGVFLYPGCSASLMLIHCYLRESHFLGYSASLPISPSSPPLTQDSSFLLGMAISECSQQSSLGALRGSTHVAQQRGARLLLWLGCLCAVRMWPFLFHHRAFNGILGGVASRPVRCHAILHWKSTFCF